MGTGRSEVPGLTASRVHGPLDPELGVLKVMGVDGRPVDLVFLILGGAGSADEHVQILRKLAALRMNEHFLRFLRDAPDKPGVIEIIQEMAGSVA